MSASLIWLLVASPRNATTGAVQTVRLAGGGKRGYRQFGSVDWWAGLERPPAIVQSLGFNDGVYGEGAVVQALQMRWGGTSARRSALTSLFWKGASFTLYCGPDGGDDASFTTILQGRFDDVASEGSIVTLSMADPSVDLARPLLAGATFAGTGGVEGVPELKGRPKRRAKGYCDNVELWSLEPANNIWVATDPALPLFAIDAVRDKGNLASSLVQIGWQGSVNATLVALRAAVCPQGGGAVAPSIACIKWWYANPGKLTCDIRGEVDAGFVASAPDIAQWLVSIIGGPGFDAGSLAAAKAARPDDCGLLVEDDASAGSLLTPLLAGVSMWWGLSAAGLISIGQWAFTAPATTMQAASVTRSRAHKPVSQVRIGYRRNHTVMARGDIAAALFYEDGTSVDAMKPAQPGATNDSDRNNVNLLLRDQKPAFILAEDARSGVNGRYPTARARAVALGLSVVALDTAHANWIATRNAVLDWADTSVNSVIVRSVWNTVSSALDVQLNLIDVAISTEDARRADWLGVDDSNGTRPENNATRGGNVIYNGDAEVGTTAGLYQYYNTTTATLAVVNNVARTGTSSFLSIKPAISDTTIIVWRCFPVKPGQVYRGRASMGSSQASANGLAIRCFNMAAKPADGFVDNAFPPTTDLIPNPNAPVSVGFTDYELNYTVPANTFWAAFCIWHFSGAPPQLFIDDVELKLAEDFQGLIRVPTPIRNVGELDDIKNALLGPAISAADAAAQTGIANAAAAALTAQWSGVSNNDGNKPANGATRNVGQGAYAPGASYQPGDLVNWGVSGGGDGSGYVRIGAGSTTGTPPSDASKWAKIVAAGSQGNPGTNGTNGLSIRKCYQRSATAPAAPSSAGFPPSGWTANVPAANGQAAWSTDVSVQADMTTVVGSFTTPVLHEAVAGSNDAPGTVRVVYNQTVALLGGLSTALTTLFNDTVIIPAGGKLRLSGAVAITQIPVSLDRTMNVSVQITYNGVQTNKFAFQLPFDATNQSVDMTTFNAALATLPSNNVTGSAATSIQVTLQTSPGSSDFNEQAIAQFSFILEQIV